jgi:hypothetical protein
MNPAGGEGVDRFDGGTRTTELISGMLASPQLLGWRHMGSIRDVCWRI